MLQQVEFVVESSFCEQLLMISCFSDNSFVQHNDFIGFLNGRKSVRNNNGGAVTHEVGRC